MIDEEAVVKQFASYCQKIFHRSRNTICGQRHRAVKMLHEFVEGVGNE